MLLINFASFPYETKVQILHSVDRASPYNLVNETNLMHDLFLVYFINFIYNLYIFRTPPCPSSGATTVFMRHLVFVILYSCLVFSMEWNCIPDSQLYGITSTKCHVNTVVPPEDGTGEVRNMLRLINKIEWNTLRINCAPIWFHLQDYKVQSICISNDNNNNNKNENRVYIYEFENAVRCEFSAVLMSGIQIFWVIMPHSGALISDVLTEWPGSSEWKTRCYYLCNFIINKINIKIIYGN
jgi:hypothetical protein